MSSGLVVKKLTADSRSELLFLYAQLDAESLYRRFGQPASAAGLERYVAGLDFERSFIAGAYAGTELVGVCEAIAVPGLLVPVSELAFVVSPQHRGNRVGFSLGNTVFDTLPGKLAAVCVVANPAMTRLATRLGMARASSNAAQGLPTTIVAELITPHGLFVGTGRKPH